VFAGPGSGLVKVKIKVNWFVRKNQRIKYFSVLFSDNSLLDAMK
jgi:hypothetical protein